MRRTTRILRLTPSAQRCSLENGVERPKVDRSVLKKRRSISNKEAACLVAVVSDGREVNLAGAHGPFEPCAVQSNPNGHRCVRSLLKNRSA
jgi:hypothetical protein